MATATKHFEVKLVRSGAGHDIKQRKTLAGLGLKRTGRVVFLKDTPAVRGMLYQVVHLVQVTPHAGEPPLSSRGKARAFKKKAKG
jgi:large subunit ribosomal protein L30